MSLGALLSLPFLVAGAAFVGAGTVGLLRFPDALCRLHALAKADSAGLGLLAVGLLLYEGSLATGLKLLLIAAVVLVGSATNCHLLARAAQAEDRSGER